MNSITESQFDKIQRYEDRSGDSLGYVIDLTSIEPDDLLELATGLYKAYYNDAELWTFFTAEDLKKAKI